MRTLRSKVGLVFQYPEHQLFEVDVFLMSAGPKNLGLSGQPVSVLFACFFHFFFG